VDADIADNPAAELPGGEFIDDGLDFRQFGHRPPSPFDDRFYS
jgi:hypothetical protein